MAKDQEGKEYDNQVLAGKLNDCSNMLHEAQQRLLGLISPGAKEKMIQEITSTIEGSGEGLLDDDGVDPEAARMLAEEIFDILYPDSEVKNANI